jgi:putative ABC transport system ATP-binding protein
LTGVAFRWPGGFGLTIPEFAVAPGERVFLAGPSGSGKSTLLGLICGTLRPDAGRVTVAGQDLGELSGGRLDRFRAERIGVIFQMFNLLPYASGLDNVLLPLRFAPERRRRVAAPQAEALRLLGGLGLPESLMRRAPAAELSVGQQQRVAVARAIIGSPPIILADEPTSALDADARAEFIDLLFAQVAEAGAALVMVSHDAGLADRFDRRIELRDIAEIHGAQAAWA